MSSQILSHAMYRRESTDQERPLEIDHDHSRSNSPKNMKYYTDDKTVLNSKKSFCIDALLSKHVEETRDSQSLQDRMAHQKYFQFTKNYITRYQNEEARFQESENFESKIEPNTIEKYQENQNYQNFDSRETESQKSGRSGQSSPRSGSPISDDGNRSASYSPPISPGVEGVSEEYDSYRPGIIPKPGLLPQNPALVAAQSALFYPQLPPGAPSGPPMTSAFHHHPGDRVLHHMQLEWLARTGMLYHRIPDLGGK
ncbi:hypothetical protein O0L34_g13298 [Tuta absoluta]|nr:hypothetical protein O0L34_g13298 [Tuta absoluta]